MVNILDDDSRSVQSFRFEEMSSMVNILDDGGYVEVAEDVVNREIVVIEALSSELSNGGALS
jgi:hypothetical protein